MIDNKKQEAKSEPKGPKSTPSDLKPEQKPPVPDPKPAPKPSPNVVGGQPKKERSIAWIIFLVIVFLVVVLGLIARGCSTSKTAVVEQVKPGVQSTTTAPPAPVTIVFPSRVELSAPGLESRMDTLSLSVLSLSAQGQKEAKAGAGSSVGSASSSPSGETPEQRLERFRGWLREHPQ